MHKYYAVLHMTSNDQVVYKWIKSKIIRKKFNIDISFYDEDKLLFVTGVERIHTIWLVQLRQTNFKYFSRICRRQITVFKDKYLFNESAFLNRPLLNILLAKSRHGVIYNFYFFVHGWSHYQVYYFPLQTFWRLYKPWLFLLWCFFARTKRNCCLWCKIEFNCAKVWRTMKELQLLRSFDHFRLFLFYYLMELFCFTWQNELSYHTTMIMRDLQ